LPAHQSNCYSENMTPEIKDGWGKFEIIPPVAALERVGKALCALVRKLPPLSGEVPYAGSRGAEGMLSKEDYASPPQPSLWD
jgi:hypothetical protein